MEAPFGNPLGSDSGIELLRPVSAFFRGGSSFGEAEGDLFALNFLQHLGFYCLATISSLIFL